MHGDVRRLRPRMAASTRRICAAKAGVKAVILCDAGVGREQAGIGGLDWLEQLGVPAAAIGHRSARIGDGADCAARGVITFANKRGDGPRRRSGNERARGARAARSRKASPLPGSAQERGAALPSGRSRSRRRARACDRFRRPRAARGRRPHRAHRLAWRAARRQAGDRDQDPGASPRSTTTPTSASTMPGSRACRCSRQRGIAGACVSAWSARIGDGQSTYHDGFITAVNARRAGLRRRDRNLRERTGGAVGRGTHEGH